ncbi:hypothetical protein [Dysgonomonas sp. Marseille-P4361]|uniref:PG1828 family lipoprotein n=1 Tax=Dysgonomonas sp. Marseille-P4361 TaxID=2161820 RepID=UPI000D55A9E5|nr:hypothetical protein [Dysgonomonas sp. Marseille-P4361]
MKKLVLSAVAILAISFASCGGNKAQEEATQEVEAVQEEVITEVKAATDSAVQVVDSLVNETVAQ